MIEKVLSERASRYGTFENHAQISQNLQKVLWASPNWENIPLDTRQAFVVMCDKMARALNGDPEYDDNFVDIIGYATLVLNRIRAKERDKAVEKELAHLGEATIFDPMVTTDASSSAIKPSTGGLDVNFIVGKNSTE